jgi:hypothetical protein
VFSGAGNGSQSVISYGPAIVNPAALTGTLAVGQASWMALPQAAALANGNIAAFATGTSTAFSQLSVVLPEGLKVSSSLPRILSGIARTTVLARSLFVIGALELLLVAGAELALAARLLASLREEESALLRARGATRWQLVRPALAEAVLLGAVGGVAGVLAGTRLTGVLAGLGGLRLERYAGVPSLAWLSAAAIVGLGAVVMAWPSLGVLTPDVARRRRGRQARLAGIASAGGDLAVVALAAVAVWELRGYSVVARSPTGSLGGPGGARHHRDGGHHLGAGHVRELAAVGRGPGRLRGRLGRAGELGGLAAAGHGRRNHRGEGRYLRDVGQRHRHR